MPELLNPQFCLRGIVDTIDTSSTSKGSSVVPQANQPTCSTNSLSQTRYRHCTEEVYHCAVEPTHPSRNSPESKPASRERLLLEATHSAVSLPGIKKSQCHKDTFLTGSHASFRISITPRSDIDLQLEERRTLINTLRLAARNNIILRYLTESSDQWGQPIDHEELGFFSAFTVRNLEERPSLKAGQNINDQRMWTEGFDAAIFARSSRLSSVEPEEKSRLCRYKLRGTKKQFHQFYDIGNTYIRRKDAWDKISAYLDPRAAAAPVSSGFEKLSAAFFLGNPVKEDYSNDEREHCTTATPKVPTQDPYQIEHYKGDRSKVLQERPLEDKKLALFLQDLVIANEMEKACVSHIGFHEMKVYRHEDYKRFLTELKNAEDKLTGPSLTCYIFENTKKGSSGSRDECLTQEIVGSATRGQVKIADNSSKPMTLVALSLGQPSKEIQITTDTITNEQMPSALGISSVHDRKGQRPNILKTSRNKNSKKQKKSENGIQQPEEKSVGTAHTTSREDTSNGVQVQLLNSATGYDMAKYHEDIAEILAVEDQNEWKEVKTRSSHKSKFMNRGLKGGQAKPSGTPSTQPVDMLPGKEVNHKMRVFLANDYPPVSSTPTKPVPPGICASRRHISSPQNTTTLVSVIDPPNYLVEVFSPKRSCQAPIAGGFVSLQNASDEQGFSTGETPYGRAAESQKLMTVSQTPKLDGPHTSSTRIQHIGIDVHIPAVSAAVVEIDKTAEKPGKDIAGVDPKLKVVSSSGNTGLEWAEAELISPTKFRQGPRRDSLPITSSYAGAENIRFQFEPTRTRLRSNSAFVGRRIPQFGDMPGPLISAKTNCSSEVGHQVSSSCQDGLYNQDYGLKFTTTSVLDSNLNQLSLGTRNETLPLYVTSTAVSIPYPAMRQTLPEASNSDSHTCFSTLGHGIYNLRYRPHRTPSVQTKFHQERQQTTRGARGGQEINSNSRLQNRSLCEEQSGNEMKMPHQISQKVTFKSSPLRCACCHGARIPNTQAPMWLCPGCGPSCGLFYCSKECLLAHSYSHADYCIRYESSQRMEIYSLLEENYRWELNPLRPIGFRRESPELFRQRLFSMFSSYGKFPKVTKAWSKMCSNPAWARAFVNEENFHSTGEYHIFRSRVSAGDEEFSPVEIICTVKLWNDNRMKPALVRALNASFLFRNDIIVCFLYRMLRHVLLCDESFGLWLPYNATQSTILREFNHQFCLEYGVDTASYQSVPDNFDLALEPHSIFTTLEAMEDHNDVLSRWYNDRMSFDGQNPDAAS